MVSKDFSPVQDWVLPKQGCLFVSQTRSLRHDQMWTTMDHSECYHRVEEMYQCSRSESPLEDYRSIDDQHTGLTVRQMTKLDGESVCRRHRVKTHFIGMIDRRVFGGCWSCCVRSQPSTEPTCWRILLIVIGESIDGLLIFFLGESDQGSQEWNHFLLFVHRRVKIREKNAFH